MRGSPTRWVLWVWVCLLCILPRTALGHQNSVTWLRVTAQGRTVETEFRVDSLDLNEALGLPAGRDVTRAEALDRAPQGAQYLVSRFRVTNAGHRCSPESHRARLREREGGFELVLTVPFACPHALEDLGLGYDLFFDVDPRHQGLATIDAFGGRAQVVFREATRTYTQTHRVPLRSQLGQYVSLGVEHIFLGYDHIAFLFGLLLVVGARRAREGAREVLGIVTAFTVAHSLTLVGSALGWFALSPRVVEPAIALSIAVVALENLLSREPRGRWALTFGFGLVHGFGFAGVLSELGLPARGLVPSLLAFNVGVELGQLAVVLAALPVLATLAQPRWNARILVPAGGVLLGTYYVLTRAGVPALLVGLVLFLAVPALGAASRRWGYPRGVRKGGSAVLALLAFLWFFERVAGRTVLGGVLG